MTLEPNDWFINAEIIPNCINLHLRVYEIPIEFYSRGTRKSFVKARGFLEFLRHVIEYRLRSYSALKEDK
jgi:hypothetical protein